MRTIHQGHLPVRTLVLIGMVILITAQAYAQNANARLTITLRNATLKEFVKLIETLQDILLSTVKKSASVIKSI